MFTICLWGFCSAVFESCGCRLIRRDLLVLAGDSRVPVGKLAASVSRPLGELGAVEVEDSRLDLLLALGVPLYRGAAEQRPAGMALLSPPSRCSSSFQVSVQGELVLYHACHTDSRHKQSRQRPRACGQVLGLTPEKAHSHCVSHHCCVTNDPELQQPSTISLGVSS